VYLLVAVDRHGNASAPATFAVTAGPPLASYGALALAAPSPNPSRDRAALAFTLPGTAPVTLEIFDLSGRRVRVLASGLLEAGEHRIDWDLRDAAGQPVRPGMFTARLCAAGEVRTRRLAVVR
jgi:hypothetical protein